LIGTFNPNPTLDTSLYEVEFGDGQIGTYPANIIAENVFEQVDDDGLAHVILDSINDQESKGCFKLWKGGTSKSHC
jgi:hypothetical protein